MDVAAAIDKVADLARGAQEHDVLQKALDREPRGKYLLIQTKDGLYDQVTPDPAWHSENILTVPEMARYIQKMESLKTPAELEPEDFEGELPFGVAQVFVNELGVKYVHSIRDRRDTSWLKFNRTPAAEFLSAHAKQGTQVDQKTLIRLLTVTLAGTVEASGGLVTLLRNISWEGNGTDASNLQRGNQSVAKSIVTKLNSEGAVPEFFKVQTPWFRELAVPVEVQVYLEPLPETRQFFVWPVPVQVEKAVAGTLEAALECFNRPEFPAAFLGDPGGK